MGKLVFYLSVGVLAASACGMIYVLSNSWWLGLGIASLLILIVAREIRKVRRDKVRRKVRPHGHSFDDIDPSVRPKSLRGRSKRSNG